MLKKLLVVLIPLMPSLFTFAAPTANDVKAKTHDAAKAAVDFTTEYSKEQRDAFVNKMETNLSSIKKEIASLKAKANQKTQERLEQLESRQAKLEQDLSNLKKSSGKAWSKLRDGVSRAWTQVEESFSEAKQELRR